MGIFRQGVMKISVLRGACVLLLALGAASCDGAAGAPMDRTALAAGNGAAAAADPEQVHAFYPSAAGFFLAAREAEMSGDRALAAKFMAEALKLDPTNPDLLRGTFELALAEGHIEEADHLARAIVATRPEDQLPNYLLAVEEVRDGRPKAAIARMQRLPKVELAVVTAPMIEAWALAGEGKTNEALGALDALASLRGFSVLRDFHAAMIEDLAGRTAEAETDYKKALAAEASPSYRVVEALANFYARHGRNKEAVALFERYKDSVPDTVRVEQTIKELRSGKPAPHLRNAKDGLAEALFDLGSALRQGSDDGISLQFVQLSLVVEPGFDLSRLTLADILSSEQRDGDALAIYRSIPPSSPLYYSARLRVAEALHNMGKLDEAVKELEVLAARWPSRPEALATEGDFLRAADRFADAAKAYDRAIARLNPVKPADWSLFYARGVALERAGDWPPAEKDFLESLKLSPDQPSVLNYLGYSWVDRGIHLDKAKGLIERAVQLRPNDGYIVDSLGWVLYREGQYQSAVTNLERAVELRPDDPVINDHLGDAYWRVGRENEARYQWRRALSLKPDSALETQLGLKLEHGLKVEKKSGEHNS
ncbi:MAG TPA: tetratricopeptide repeat protein [Alphaproteobacteria bacterium]|nr:tetratricopeptide repeat protein [Alphaproteobacteria bacterium]